MRKLTLNATACSLLAALSVPLPGTGAIAGEADSTAAEAATQASPPAHRASDAATAGKGTEQSESTGSAGKAPAGLERLEELNLLSEALVEKAGSGSAPAHQFRIEARMYRELLRQTMLSDRERPAKERLPQPLLLDMVRMSALLHSAADCKTGFVITCPADLMLQLKSQQARVTQGLNMTKLMYE